MSAWDPEWVKAFVDEHRDELPPLSVREALRRITPSYNGFRDRW